MTSQSSGNEPTAGDRDEKELGNEFYQEVFNLAEEYEAEGVDNATLGTILGFASSHQKGTAEANEYVGALVRFERDIYERCREADEELPAYEISNALREVAEMYRYKGQNRSRDAEADVKEQ